MSADPTPFPREAQAYLRAIFQYSPECLKIVGADGILLDMNPAGLRMLEADSAAQVLQRPIHLVVAEEDRAAMQDLHDRVMRGADGMLEFSIVGLKGTRRRLETRATPLRDASGAIIAVLGITRDITDRKRAEQEAREAALRLRVAVEASNIGLWDWDLNRNEVRTLNIWGQLGYAGGEVADGFDAWRDHLHPDDRERAVSEVRDYLAHPNGGYEAQFRMRHKDGGYRDILAKGSLLRDEAGAPARLVGSHVDLTERRAAEERIRESNRQLRELSRQLAEARERERRLLSTELHDLVGQNLTALSIDLGLIEVELSVESRRQVGNRLREARALLESTIAAVRTMITDLRPVVLDEYGLLAALKSHAKAVEQRSGLAVAVVGDEGGERLPAEVEIALFRIAQEALTNIVKHARASRAWITLARGHGDVRLTVADDGVGFYPANIVYPDTQSHLGLLAMQERAEAFGGRLSIDSTPGNGTRVHVDLPGRA